MALSNSANPDIIVIINKDEDSIKHIFKKLQPYKKDSPLLENIVFKNGKTTTIHYNWFEYLTIHVIEIKDLINQINKYQIYLDPELEKQLNNIDDCIYFKQFEMLHNHKITNSDLEFLCTAFFRYMELIQPLKNTYEKIKKRAFKKIN